MLPCNGRRCFPELALFSVDKSTCSTDEKVHSLSFLNIKHSVCSSRSFELNNFLIVSSDQIERRRDFLVVFPNCQTF